MKTQILKFDTAGALRLAPVENTRYVLESVVCLDIGIGGGENSKKGGQKSLEIIMEKPDVVCEVYCGYRVDKGQGFDLLVDISHVAPNTKSKILVKGVLDDGGVSSFKGSVKVEATAKGSKTSLEDRALVIGDSVYNHAEPIMQIETDDVEASHASTTGRVDESQLFYLQSRGLSHKEAQELLVNAFLEVPIEQSSI